ncbi:MAG: c-type cytochrome [Lentisphaerales bacterium]|nr:c-type cytochrome [Lentisphaerales bacterium]
MTIMKGKWHFEKRCAFCHEKKGQGGVAPNLTDNHYIYGPTKAAMSHIVRNGIKAKGMPEWQKILPKDQVDAIIEYVWSIRGTNVKGKAPEGVKFYLIKKEK